MQSARNHLQTIHKNAKEAVCLINYFNQYIYCLKIAYTYLCMKQFPIFIHQIISSHLPSFQILFVFHLAIG